MIISNFKYHDSLVLTCQHEGSLPNVVVGESLLIEVLTIPFLILFYHFLAVPILPQCCWQRIAR